MKPTIIFDLDGVLRDVNKVVYGFEPEVWNQRHPESNETFLDILKSDPSLLLQAPPTEYLNALMTEYSRIEIATCQYQSWVKYTEEWLKRYIPFAEVKWFPGFAGQEKNDYVTKTRSCILVEDSPMLQNYDDIILIDHPYNRHIRCKTRVTNPEQFMREVRKWK